MSKENVIPVFRFTSNFGMNWRTDRYHSLDTFFSDTQGITGLMEMSLDGEKFYSMTEIKTILFMHENGLGPEDMRNDITKPENQE